MNQITLFLNPRLRPLYGHKKRGRDPGPSSAPPYDHSTENLSSVL